MKITQKNYFEKALEMPQMIKITLEPPLVLQIF